MPQKRTNNLDMITGRNSWIYQFPGPAMGIQFDGDKKTAEGHIREAMSMMHGLKNYMKLGLLTSHSSSKRLDDGTEITVLSFNGNDRIIVNSPSRVVSMVEDKFDFRFKIFSSGVPMVGNNPAQTMGVLFTVTDYVSDIEYNGGYPFNPTDKTASLLVFFDEEKSIWILRKRDTLPPDLFGFREAVLSDVTGDYFDQDKKYFVEYSFTTDITGNIHYASTQYPGVFSVPFLPPIGTWDSIDNAVYPGYYEDNILTFSNYELPPVPVTWFVYHINSANSWLVLALYDNPDTRWITYYFRCENILAGSFDLWSKYDLSPYGL